jgi:hypothetical protein
MLSQLATFLPVQETCAFATSPLPQARMQRRGSSPTINPMRRVMPSKMIDTDTG